MHSSLPETILYYFIPLRLECNLYELLLILRNNNVICVRNMSYDGEEMPHL